MVLRKPKSVADNESMSAKWDEIVAGRNFTKADIPTIKQLCYWSAILDRCMDDITVGDQIQVAYSNAVDDIKPLPQIATMKQASAEIRALNKQLGINDEAKPQEKKKVTPLAIVAGRRQDRVQGAARRAGSA